MEKVSPQIQKQREMHSSRTQQRSHYYSIFPVSLLILHIIGCSLSNNNIRIAIPSVTAMRIVVQRVKSASVTVDGQVISSIGPGILGLVGIHEHDSGQNIEECTRKILGCKLWANPDGKPWKHSVKQKDYELLLVSQFTLYGTLSKRQQPDYKLAMKNVPARVLYHKFLDTLRQSYAPGKIHDGEFGAMMDVSLVNDGPVTIVIESEPHIPPSPDVSEEIEEQLTIE
jgi:D-tyrosyl-tRNA(Tyr) deacylase